MASVDGEQDVPSKLISQQWALSFHLTPLDCLGFLSGHSCTMMKPRICVLSHLLDGLEAEVTHVQQC